MTHVLQGADTPGCRNEAQHHKMALAHGRTCPEGLWERRVSMRPLQAPCSPQLSGLAALGSSYVTSDNRTATTHVAARCSCRRRTH